MIRLRGAVGRTTACGPEIRIQKSLGSPFWIADPDAPDDKPTVHNAGLVIVSSHSLPGTALVGIILDDTTMAGLIECWPSLGCVGMRGVNECLRLCYGLILNAVPWCSKSVVYGFPVFMPELQYYYDYDRGGNGPVSSSVQVCLDLVNF